MRTARLPTHPRSPLPARHVIGTRIHLAVIHVGWAGARILSVKINISLTIGKVAKW